MVAVSIGVPGITVRFDEISLPARRKKKADPAGPFLIIARECGLALDTGRRSQAGAQPLLWPPHADRHQLWQLQPSGVAGEVLIVSAANGLALDSTDRLQEPDLVMWTPNRETWQRWRLEKAPDGVAFSIQSVYNRRCLTAGEELKPEGCPRFDEPAPRWSQQWIFALPHGGDPAER